MSTSELRRGPGWWMDLDGQWNPPEEWPESSPPLPGWVRGADGLWAPPTRRVSDSQSDSQNGATGQSAPVTEFETRHATIDDFTTSSSPRPIPDIGPLAVPALDSIASSDLTAQAPPLRPNPTRPVTASSRALSFSQATANPVIPDVDRTARRARHAALLAAVTATMLAAGLVLLLLLL